MSKRELLIEIITSVEKLDELLFDVHENDFDRKFIENVVKMRPHIYALSKQAKNELHKIEVSALRASQQPLNSDGACPHENWTTVDNEHYCYDCKSYIAAPPVS